MLIHVVFHCNFNYKNWNWMLKLFFYSSKWPISNPFLIYFIYHVTESWSIWLRDSSWSLSLRPFNFGRKLGSNFGSVLNSSARTSLTHWMTHAPLSAKLIAIWNEKFAKIVTWETGWKYLTEDWIKVNFDASGWSLNYRSTLLKIKFEDIIVSWDTIKNHWNKYLVMIARLINFLKIFLWLFYFNSKMETKQITVTSQNLYITI